MMKQFMIVLMISFINKGCSQSVTQEDVINSITYSAITRGSSYECSLDGQKIAISSTGEVVENKTGNISRAAWEDLNEKLKGLSLKEIPRFKSPTTDSAVDRARTAKVIVEANGGIYESQPFDEGNPPTELKSLIDTILTLAETVE